MVRAAALCDQMVRAEDLPTRIREGVDAPASAVGPLMDVISAGGAEKWPTLAEVEKHYVARVIAHTGGNKQAAARLLGVDRKTLKRMIDRHNLAE